VSTAITTGAWAETLLGAPSATVAGDRIFSSALFARDATSTESQGHQIFRTAIELVHGQGAELSDVARTRLYYTDEDSLETLKMIHGVVFNSPGPVMTAVRVDCLPRDSKVALEIEAIKGGGESARHIGIDAETSSCRAIRIGDQFFGAGYQGEAEQSHDAQMDATYAAASATLAEAGMGEADVAATRHYYAYSVRDQTDGTGKNDFMGHAEPTSAGICVHEPGESGNTFSLEIEAAAGANSRKNFRTGRTFEVENNYSRAVRVGDVIYVAGTTSIIPDEVIQHPGEVGPQVDDTLAIIRDAIEQLGSAWTDVVRTRTYIVGGLPALDEASARLKANLAGTESVATLMGVPVLGRSGVVVEIEATAVLEK
jgi:enamine deaminase RidA (YjgF/YER057c/UK114 family)